MRSSLQGFPLVPFAPQAGYSLCNLLCYPLPIWLEVLSDPCEGGLQPVRNWHFWWTPTGLLLVTAMGERTCWRKIFAPKAIFLAFLGFGGGGAKLAKFAKQMSKEFPHQREVPIEILKWNLPWGEWGVFSGKWWKVLSSGPSRVFKPGTGLFFFLISEFILPFFPISLRIRSNGNSLSPCSLLCRLVQGKSHHSSTLRFSPSRSKAQKIAPRLSCSTDAAAVSLPGPQEHIHLEKARFRDDIRPIDSARSSTHSQGIGVWDFPHPKQH